MRQSARSRRGSCLVDGEVDALAADGGGVEDDLERQLEAVCRDAARRACRRRPPRSAPGSRCSGAARPAGGGRRGRAAATNGGRAVHDRHLGAVELDDGVVDAEAGERRHQVLDGRDGDAGVVADHGARAGSRRHCSAQRRNATACRRRCRCGRRRCRCPAGAGQDRDVDRPAVVDADAGETRRRGERVSGRRARAVKRGAPSWSATASPGGGRSRKPTPVPMQHRKSMLRTRSNRQAPTAAARLVGEAAQEGRDLQVLARRRSSASLAERRLGLAAPARRCAGCGRRRGGVVARTPRRRC